MASMRHISVSSLLSPSRFPLSAPFFRAVLRSAACFFLFSMDRLGSPEPRLCRESPTTKNTEAPAEWRGLLCCGKKPLWEGWMRLDRVLTIAKPLIARNTAGQEPAGKISFSTFCANSVQFP